MYTAEEKRAYWISLNARQKEREIQKKVDEANRFINDLLKMQDDEIDEIDEIEETNPELYKALCDECLYRYGQMIEREQNRRDSLWFPSPTNEWFLNQFLPSFKDGQRVSEKQCAIFARYGDYDPQHRIGVNVNGKIYRITEEYKPLYKRYEYVYTLEIIAL